MNVAQWWRWVGEVTGRVTMYRLVLSSLGALAALSLIGSLFGLIPYAPSAILLSLAVPLTVSYLSNRLLAGIFGVTPHSESSLISGYLIFFIFPPSQQTAALTALALAAVFGSASKYLLAFRGRHIFNPAAMGAFAVTITGLYYTGWWVGNPIMAPFAVLAAVLILERTRRLTMGAVFVLVSGGIMIARSLAADVSWPTALVWPVVSSPMIFFAGFMLSEPLTQPPRRWQQLLCAAGVGILFSTPMHLGSVYLAPESALLAGNVLAFVFGQRGGIHLVLGRTTHLTPTTLEFSFTPTRKLRFRPGQYVELTVPHRGADGRGLRRVFSIASSATEVDRLAIGTKIPENASTFKQALAALPRGTGIEATSIAGDFLLPGDISKPVLLVAAGIGITPFIGQLSEPRGLGRDIVLVYAVSAVEEISYRPVLQDCAARVVLICPTAPEPLPDGWEWIAGSRVDQQLLARCVPDITRRHVYISGPPAMVSAAQSAARRLHAAHIRTDHFSGY